MLLAVPSACSEICADLQFFQQYSKLLESSNYVTRRQSLKVSGLAAPDLLLTVNHAWADCLPSSSFQKGLHPAQPVIVFTSRMWQRFCGMFMLDDMCLSSITLTFLSKPRACNHLGASSKQKITGYHQCSSRGCMHNGVVYMSGTALLQ